MRIVDFINNKNTTFTAHYVTDNEISLNTWCKSYKPNTDICDPNSPYAYDTLFGNIDPNEYQREDSLEYNVTYDYIGRNNKPAHFSATFTNLNEALNFIANINPETML